MGLRRGDEKCVNKSTGGEEEKDVGRRWRGRKSNRISDEWWKKKRRQGLGEGSGSGEESGSMRREGDEEK